MNCRLLLLLLLVLRVNLSHGLCSEPSSATVQSSISRVTEIAATESRVLATNAYFRIATATRDGGFVSVAGVHETNPPAFEVAAFDAAGVRKWAQVTTNVPTDILEETNGNLLLLCSASKAILRIGSGGAIVKTQSELQGDYTKLMADEEGYLVGGTRTDCDYFYFTRISSNLEIGATMPVGKLNQISCSLPAVHVLRATSDGGFIFGLSESFRLIKVDAGGTIKSDSFFYGSQTLENKTHHLIDVLPTSDGGMVLAGSCDNLPGYAKQAPNFGSTDYWMIKIGSDGKQHWDRTYGGSSGETLASVVHEGTGGFLLVGWSGSEAPSGNKTTAGTGCWIVKVDAGGIKQGETLISDYALASPQQAIAVASGFKVFSSYQPGDGTLTVWQSNLSVLGRVVISVDALGGQPYSMETSSDLVTWAKLLNEFSGDFEMRESPDQPQKFWRVHY